MEVAIVGWDIAKNVFQVHAVDEGGQVLVRRALKRAQMIPFFSKLGPCLIGIEACGTSHHWARELVRLGHEVRLMPPAYVKPYVKRGKTDAGDAEAICEAVSRPTMRFVPVTSTEQQVALSLHRTRVEGVQCEPTWALGCGQACCSTVLRLDERHSPGNAYSTWPKCFDVGKHGTDPLPDTAAARRPFRARPL